jgi:hypothetical protein
MDAVLQLSSTVGVESACGALAGALAETLHTRCWQQQPTSDQNTDEAKVWEIASYFYFDPPTKADEWVNRLRFQTLETLRTPEVWAAVDTIAQELVKRNTLNGTKVRALVRAALPCGTEAAW